jgi:ATP-grasp ribosomal peptide maturase
MGSTTVLVITDAEDSTANRVTAELAMRGIPVVKIDAADFPTGLRLSATLAHHNAGWNGTISGKTLDGRVVGLELGDVRSVYYRRPTEFVLQDGMSGPEQQFAYDEARKGFGGVLQGLDCLWINHPVAAARAEYKPVQLAAAGRCGLRIPRTTITNDPEHAAQWAQEIDRPIIYKTVGGAWHPEDGQVKVIYTSPVDDPASLRDPSLTLTAHMFQEQITKQYEARSIIVGDQIFTVAIHTDTPAGRVDWRTDYDSHSYEVVELPDHVRGGLLALHHELGLSYGACDIALDTEGDWVFFETNQVGEWGWLAEKCGIPAASALADLLEKGQT